MKRKPDIKITKRRVYFQYIIFTLIIIASFFWTLFDIASGLIAFGIQSHQSVTMKTIEDVGAQKGAIPPVKTSSSIFPPIPSALFFIGCAGFLYTEKLSSRAR